MRHIFRNLIIEFLQRYQLDIHQFDCVIPVPLFPSRQRERGYNQSQILSEEICRQYSLVLNTHWLKRKRPTQPQVDLKRQERIANMAQAFTVSNRHNLHGKTILLVDDLITTGATASEAAKTLKKAGAQRVGFLALAGAF